MWLEDIIKLNSLIPPLDPANIEHHIPHEPELGGKAMVVDFGDVGGEFGDEENIMGGGILGEGGEDGHIFLNLFDSDENSVHRKNNLYYPFSSQRDWQVAAWLLRSGLSMGKIDSFLSLEMIKDLPLSFSSAKELRGRAEMLPSSPRWMSKVIPTLHATKSPVVLYWRDPLECIASIFNNPLFHNHIDFRPRKVYTTAEKQCHVYTEWMTGNDAWDMQAAIPSGATLLSTILSSNKTNITALTGDHIAHPLLISLANIHMNIQLKLSLDAFVLTALLPVPKFVHKKKRMKGVLEDHLIHQSMMLAMVGGKTSPVTMAMYKQFGDAFQHEPQMKSTTLAQCTVVRSRADPLNIEAFFCEAQKFRLNGVAEPFFQDWILIEPSRFFTPEDLHHIHKEFWDHDAQWLICAVGESKIDFWFSILQPITGYQHFYGGISKLKQVTGHCHCDVQQYIIAVCADAAPGVLTAVHALMQFRYCVQSPCINDDDIRHISGALDEFHSNKDSIIANIVPSIHNSGVIRQWSVDVTEHANCQHFELTTSLLDAKQTTEQLENTNIDADDADAGADTPIKLPHYFAIARALQYRPVGSVPLPLHSFVVGHTAFHITYDPSIRNISIDRVTIKFSLPDLQPAIADFIQREVTCGDQHIYAMSSPRRGAHMAILPFDQVQVWFKVHLQETEFHDAYTIRPAQTLNCAPPCNPWNLGHYDAAIVQTSAGFSWPSSGLSGMGDVIPLSQLRVPINLVPRFGATADKHLTVYNSMEHAIEFWLNEYWEKKTHSSPYQHSI
ncbi:hypothetical protein CY34DRAFT_26607 [Suillus luteus UH-Slu-Lm8-n1]|uniref:DUF6830 domain-containing protein n=1 Tax=Suillus luteus UH-Slu-Lm8-n1 TaxID=930992 RepID=A0A0D0AU73_9AGAM|nr:hypothetical protein CY34DRAFT_26607 [Suillus luteus UH-Slu-Lm8-n1]